jgi:hypothetical protein
MIHMTPPDPPVPQAIEALRANNRARTPSGKATRKAAETVPATEGPVDLTKSDEVTLDNLKSVLERTREAALKNADAARCAQSATVRREESGVFRRRGK